MGKIDRLFQRANIIKSTQVSNGPSASDFRVWIDGVCNGAITDEMLLNGFELKGIAKRCEK